MNFSFIAGFAESIKSWFEGWFGAILSIIPKLFYQLTASLFSVLDLLQLMVRKLAGLETIKYAGEEYNGDLVLYFINMIFSGESPVLRNVFWSLIILGIVMLVITTFIAVVRSEYAATDAKSASKGKIIAGALKALFSFMFVPVVCFFGMFLCNVILKAIDMATTSNGNGDNLTYTITEFDEEGNPITSTKSYLTYFSVNDEGSYYNYSILGAKIPTSTTPISGLIFKASAYNANRARTSVGDKFYTEMMNNDGVSAGIFNLQKGTNEAVKEKNCDLIDSAFANTFKLRENTKLDKTPFLSSHMFPFNGNVIGSIADNAIFDSGFQYFDKNNTAIVWYYYDLWAFDFITAIGATIATLATLLYIVFGLIKRMFELLILFLISAPIASLMPLDNGNALKKWREKFVAKAIGTYGPIAGLNLFFIILTLFSNIQLIGFPIADRLVNVIFTIAGLAMVKDFTNLISELVGGEDTLKSGADKAQDIGAMAKKVGTSVATVAGGAGFLMKKGAIAANTGKKLVKAEYRRQAKDGEGRYAKGSTSYNNAVENMADGISVSDEEAAQSISDEQLANNMTISDKEQKDIRHKIAESKVKSKEDWYNNVGKEGGNRRFGNKTYDQLSSKQKSLIEKDYKNYATHAKQKAYSEVTDEEMNNAISQAKQEKFASLTADQKSSAKAEAYNNMSDTQKEEVKRNVAKQQASAKLDEMAEKDWKGRKEIIDANFRSAGQNERIRQRAIKAVGGIENYKALSHEERQNLFNQSRRGNFEHGNKVQQTLVNAQKVVFGDNFGKQLADAFKEFGGRASSFASGTLGQAEGNFMKGSKGTLSSMLNQFQGKTKKEIGMAEEVKNQKKALKAQDTARDKLGLGNPPKPKQPETVKLDSATIEAIAKSTANQNRKEQSNTVTIDSKSMSDLADRIADKLKDKK